jgi:hypothetical protein
MTQPWILSLFFDCENAGMLSWPVFNFFFLRLKWLQHPAYLNGEAASSPNDNTDSTVAILNFGAAAGPFSQRVAHLLRGIQLRFVDWVCGLRTICW